ncbi:hypothetical protein BVC80_1821g40 [Macleaya cordata]|uniref:Uncharacterized protein n=1 Tax=Macleaya cordata TaxID=56857 RepID=A0A200QZM7_MACCD|nr:hypothetical protein BVC80_1821g40 [Macleaya cordata]
MVPIHLMTVTKLRFIYLFKLSPLLWPFNLYLPLARQLPRICDVLSNASSLFVFRLRLILAQEGGGAHQDHLIHGGGGGGRNRWERAFRLFCQEVLPSAAQLRRNRNHEATLHLMLLNAPV